jgi:hypothetical protein
MLNWPSKTYESRCVEMSNPEGQNDLLVAEAPTACMKCGKPLCLRKQVVNLALGNADEMYCLVCLAELGETAQSEPLAILLKVKPYILNRDCFQKEWVKYKNSEYCPDKTGCFMNDCFAE